jgi:phosphonate metabolism protein PhnN/1,5-bisphosphokinase (PRPP-forming)
MAGTLVLVVGPSGAGKDTLIAAARTALADDPRFVFPRREVTRPAVAAVEDHESVSEAAFAMRLARGAYALSWEAHGLRYGLPASIADDIAAGRIAVCNGSRSMAKAAAARFPRTRVVLIEAAPEVRAARLAGRGRENAAEIAARLRREAPDVPPGASRIDNSGALENGIAAFLNALKAIARD